jgi:sugar phosphate isomerase/epimerase
MMRAALAWLCGAALAAAAEPEFFAMDTGTRDAGHQTAEAQVALVKEIGFAGIAPTYTAPEALREMLAAVERHHLKLSALYVHLDLDQADAPGPEIRGVIDQLRGRKSILWLYVTSSAWKPSDPAGDARAVPILRHIAELAEPAGVRVALYPHAEYWMERIEDAVRLADRVNHENLGVTFNLCHWLKVDGQELEARLELAKPRLFAVTVNGADAGGKDWARLIQPLGSGDFDISRLMAKLRNIGFTGPICLQHFGIPGDARENLQKSMDAWKTEMVAGSRGLPCGPPVPRARP